MTTVSDNLDQKTVYIMISIVLINLDIITDGFDQIKIKDKDKGSLVKQFPISNEPDLISTWLDTIHPRKHCRKQDANFPLHNTIHGCVPSIR